MKTILAGCATIVATVAIGSFVLIDWYSAIEETICVGLGLGLGWGWMSTSRAYKAVLVFLGVFIVSLLLYFEQEARVIVYRNTAKLGHADAQYRLGECYAKGDGVETNEAEAVKWYRKAAEQGHADAQYNLAQCYSYGNGVETNEVEAVKWLCKAAEQGHVDAQYSLAQCYSYGKGVETNEEEAVKWLRKAAEQGHVDAQYSLAQCYSYGKEPLLSDVQESIVFSNKRTTQKGQ